VNCASGLEGGAGHCSGHGTRHAVGLVNGAAILIAVDGNHSRAKNYRHAAHPNHRQSIARARALAGLTIEDLAARAQLHRQSVRKWEGSSNAVPDAMVAHLSRALDVLEAEGIRFTDGGVQMQRSASAVTTVIHSEGAAA
jgi:ribosome-binding protein aMBF1 (putative translation factor)